MAEPYFTPSITPVLSNRRLTINLRQKEGDFVEVQSCEVAGNDFLNRTTFRANRCLEDVFVTRLAEALADLMATLPSGAHMLSKPDFVLELPGAILAGVRLLVSETRNGARTMIVRFKEFLGGVNKLMKAEICGVEEAANRNAENLAVNALVDICVPIMNFCRSAEFEGIGGGGHASRIVEDKVREFEFHAELLKRYLAAQDVAASENAKPVTIDRQMKIEAASPRKAAAS